MRDCSLTMTVPVSYEDVRAELGGETDRTWLRSGYRTVRPECVQFRALHILIQQRQMGEMSMMLRM
jgi:hypothetical protein